MIAAFFDLDGTLLGVNSGWLWMRRERRHGRLSAVQMSQAVFYMTLYRFGLVPMEGAMRRALKTVEGMTEHAVRACTREWFLAEVTPHVAAGARPAIEEHRRQGHRLVLLTSSSPYESEVACEHFGLDAFLSTRYEVRGGRFTGGVELPICYGQGKVVLAERYAEQHDVDLAASYFYTDSITDLPMLLRVGRPRVVMPDPRLRREARRRGWEVQDWRA
jgi:HAD superfamily hydrolase (TIGR01490 family)